MSGQSAYAVLDLETTGFDPASDKIIEISVYKLKRGLIIDEYSSLINPGFALPQEITALTGISDDDLKGKPELCDIIEEVRDFIGDAVIVAHNAGFDRGFIGRHLKEANGWLDTISLAQIAYPMQKSYSLKNLLSSLGIKNDCPHRASGDAAATAELFFRCIERIKALDKETKALLFFLAQESIDPLSRLIAANTGMTGDDSSHAVKLPEAERENGSKKKDKKTAEDYYLEPAEIEKYLKKDGLIKKRFANFENRPQQLEIAINVAKCFNNKEFLIAEAGTGTGKSLAYLLPAVLYSLSSGQQVAVSTYTINLQEQLIKKDIPQLKEILDTGFEVAVLKGRSNYLCLNRYEALCRHKEKNLLCFLMRLAVWLSQTQEGDMAELSLKNHDKWKWELLSAATENCVAPQCAYCRSRCFIQKNKEKVVGADLLIVNHSLLLADAVMGGHVLPSMPYLIIDEAHQLSKAAEDQLSFCINYYQLIKELNSLKNREKDYRSGLLEQIKKSLSSHIISVSDRAIFEEKLAKLEEEISYAKTAGEAFFSQLAGSFRPFLVNSGYYPVSLRVIPKVRESENWQHASVLAGDLIRSLDELAKKTDYLWEYLSIKEDDLDEVFNEKNRLKIWSGYFRYVKSRLAMCFDNLQEDSVVWLEFPEGNDYPSLCIAPIELGEELRIRFFGNKEAVVFTSATLTTTNESFEFFTEEIGLDLVLKNIRELVLPSPFLYREQAALAIANDLPNPVKESEIVYINAIAEALIRFIEASRGRAMVLFTSHAHLKSVYEIIREPLSRQGITVLAHNISGTPERLLERLREEERCCILGASSFWEGIDVIGNALSLVILVRLPFWPPNSPVMAARLERLEAMGRNSFRDYSLPQAIIRFKQGFGRLIRSEEDSGIFLVLDCRISQNTYGRSFIRALPEMEIILENCEVIAGKIKKMLK